MCAFLTEYVTVLSLLSWCDFLKFYYLNSSSKEACPTIWPALTNMLGIPSWPQNFENKALFVVLFELKLAWDLWSLSIGNLFFLIDERNLLLGYSVICFCFYLTIWKFGEVHGAFTKSRVRLCSGSRDICVLVGS